MKMHPALPLLFLAFCSSQALAQAPGAPKPPASAPAAVRGVSVSPLPAQAPLPPLPPPVDESGSFRFFNAVSKATPTIMLINEKPFPKKGLGAGGETGAFRLPAGPVNLELRNGGLKPLKESLTVKTGEQIFSIIYLAQTYDDEKKLLVEKLKLHQVTEKNAGKGYSLTLLSTCFTPAHLKINGTSYNLEQFKPVEVRGWKGTAFSATADENVRARMFEFDYATHYFMLVYDQHDGKRAVSSVLVF